MSTEETNPFAGMQVEGDESVRGVTDSEQKEMQDAVDTNNDGVVSAEELDSAIDKLAGLEDKIIEELESDGSEVKITDVTYEGSGSENEDDGKNGSHDNDSSGGSNDTADADSSSEVSSDPITDTTEKEHEGGEMPANGTEEELSVAILKELNCPSIKSLTKIHPPSHDEANMSHQQDWARHCIKFADANNVHFLGLSVKTGEPMFKEKV